MSNTPAFTPIEPPVDHRTDDRIIGVPHKKDPEAGWPQAWINVPR